MLGAVYSPLIYTKLHRIPQGVVFNMLLGGFCANTDLPPLSFCNEPLLGSK
jgi:hypothetical protein